MTGYAVSSRWIAALALLAACDRQPKETVWHDEGAYRWTTLDPGEGGRSGFSIVSARRTGIDFVDEVAEDSILQNRHLAFGSGVALGDVDGDGRVDIFLARVGGPSALYRNLGGWKFENITARSGVEMRGRPSFGATLVDVDGDVDLDLLVTALGGPNGLFLNDGKGKFTEVTQAAGLASRLGSTTAALADVDGDGDLDLYIANYKAKNAMDIFPPQERDFDQVVRRTGDGFEVAPRFRDHYRIEMRPDLGAVVRMQKAEPDWFYLNDGKGNFTHVPFTSGRFLGEDGLALTSEPDRFGLTARFADMNGDGYPDLYVCNDFEDPDNFWLNDGKGIFRAAPRLALRNSSNSSMAVDFSDVDRDGNLDLFVVDMRSRDSRRQKTQSPTHTPLPKRIGAIDDRPQMQRNSLYLGRGDGTYAEMSSAAGVDASEWSWSTLFLDVDLDGYEDILAGTGHLWDVMDSDTWERIKSSVTGVAWHDEFKLFPKLALPNTAFRNNRNLTFTEVGRQWGFATEQAITHGMAVADLDGDGDLDVVTNRFGATPGVFRNEATAPRVAVRLRGLAPNTGAVGSRIRVLAKGLPVQQKEVTAGGMYLSASDPLYTFATGKADTLSVEIIWRYGQRTVLSGLGANRLYEIREPARVLQDKKPSPDSDSVQPLFSDVSNLLRHTHAEAPYDDFIRQPLLPNKFSQLGPGITWYDVDGNGLEDLIVASGRGGGLALFRNNGGLFSSIKVEGGLAKFDQTTILGIPGVQGGTDLLVGQSSYEAQDPVEAIGTPSVLRLRAASPAGSKPRVSVVAVPGDTASIGPMAVADYDVDGNLDLFVGGRVFPGGYPLPVSSRLFRGDGTRFVVDTANQKLLDGIGMISAALFSDLDGDGRSDLLLAPEWGPLRLLLNRNGKFVESPGDYGFARYRSRWNGIATGDLNGDGRLDIIATSWGRNTRNHPSFNDPLYLYYGNFDDNGSLDLLEAKHDDAVGGITPLETLSRLSVALPFTRQRVRTFSEYSHSTIEQVLGPALRGAQRLDINTLDNMAFINTGAGFTPSVLPAAAQMAPAFYAGVADFDGDGREDVFLSQNFFPTEIATPRYDAGVGLLLEGSGDGRLTPMSSKVSGIKVFGDQRGAGFADFDADGRIDLAISQNGAGTVLYRNRGAKQGLRVRLVGPAKNPRAIGALIRIHYSGNRFGPAREIQAGSGYWSENGATQVMGVRAGADAVWVRWPGGRTTTSAVSPGVTKLDIRYPGLQ